MTGALTLGVVGHVDHGKTALVRALTGTETDRLKEERERRLSIVLGFAFLDTGHGVVDMIDVPGHEDFIRAMIGGATGLDGIALCVAANEGVMPQTVEHFNIARLLGVDKGFIVVTKTDLVDAGRLAVVREEVERCARNTFLEGAPVLEVSAASGAGIDAVRLLLADMAEAAVERDTRGRFFLPLDRAFTIRGFGLVVTGTLRGGALCVGDAVEIQPAGKSSTVRGLQNHNRPVERAAPGQRVAVNLRHLNRADVERGDVLTVPGSVVPTRRVDAEIRLLENAAQPVKNGVLVRFLTGTTEAMARVRLLDRRELAAGETSVAQLNLDRDVATRASERFLIRSYSPTHTIGGGRILAVDTQRHRRFDASVTARLETAASGDVERILAQRLGEAGGAGVPLPALAEELGVDVQSLGAAVERLGAIRISEDVAAASGAVDALLTDAVGVLERFHREHPLKKGLDTGSLTNALRSRTSPDVVHYVLNRLLERETIQSVDDVLRIAGHDPFAGLGDRERRLVGDIEQAFLARGLQPPSPQAVVGSDKVKRTVYALLLETGRLIRLRTYDRSQHIVLHAKTLEDVKRAIARRFPYPAAFQVKDVRDLLQSTRKYVVPVMEHLDATGTTVRSGDVRRLRRGGE